MKTMSKVILGLALVAAIVGISVSAEPGTGRQPAGGKRIIVLNSNNTISLSGAIEGETTSAVIRKAKELDNQNSLVGNVMNKVGIKKNKDSIYLFLRTPGGEIQTGLEMLDALKGLNRKVDTITMFAASMGFQTVQGLGKRYIVQNGILMSHQASGQFAGSFGGSKPSQLDNRYRIWSQRMDEMDDLTVRRSGGKQTMESYRKAYTPELWVTSEEAVSQGYADEVVSVQCDETLVGNEEKHINFMGLVDITYEVDRCPLNSALMNIKVNILTTKGKKNVEQFLAEGGEFGSSCLQSSGKDSAKLCAMNSTLTLEKIYELQDKFTSQHSNIKDNLIPMHW